MSEEKTVAPLWADEEIIERYEDAFGSPPSVSRMAFARWMRDDYERIRASLTARINKLEAQLDSARKWLPDSALEDEDE